MPFTTDPRKGGDSVTLTTPGLYVFTCSIHPYMFGAVIVDDRATTGLDLGNNITLLNGITVPTSSDLATRLLRTFFIANNPANWQNYASGAPWHVTYPNVDVRVDIEQRFQGTRGEQRNAEADGSGIELTQITFLDDLAVAAGTGDDAMEEHEAKKYDLPLVRQGRA
jgi:hypothetical protein